MMRLVNRCSAVIRQNPASRRVLAILSIESIRPGRDRRRQLHLVTRSRFGQPVSDTCESGGSPYWLVRQLIRNHVRQKNSVVEQPFRSEPKCPKVGVLGQDNDTPRPVGMYNHTGTLFQ